MEENNLIDMELDYVKYCVSSVALRFAYVGMHKVVQSWNNHTIPGDLHIISFPYQLIIRTYMHCCKTVHKPFPERRAIARTHLRTRLKSPRRAIHRTPKQTKTC